MQNNNNPPEDERDPVTGEESTGGYEPPMDEPIPLATPKPKVKTLDKKKIGILAGVVGVLVAFAFITAFMPKQRQQEAPKQETAAPSAGTKAEAFNQLPGDYTTAAAQRASQVPQLGPPMPGEVGQMQYDAQQAAAARAGTTPNYGGGNYNQPTAYEQAMQQAELERLKRAQNALQSDTAFGRRGAGAQAGGGALAGLGGYTPPSPEDLMRAGMAGMPGLPDPRVERDTNNRQDDKRDFLSERGPTGAISQVIPAPSPTVISAGTLIPALFLTGINSDLPGQITAQVSQPVYDTPTGRHVVIPQGAVLVGMYDSRVTFGQNRVLLVWQRLRFPDGSSVDLESMPGVDLSGYAGVRDKVNNHWGKVISSVVLSSTLAAAVAVAEGDSYSAFERSAGQAASQGAAQQINSAGQQIVQRSLNIQPTLEIRPGQRVAVMVNKDMALAPYGR